MTTDQQSEQRLGDLLRRAADRAPAADRALIDTSIANGRERQRRDRHRTVAAVGLAAAVAGAALTLGVTALRDRDPGPAEGPRTVHGFGVTPAAMGENLRSLLPPDAVARADSDLPLPLAEVLLDLGFPDPSGGAVSRSGVADLGDASVGVVVRRDSTDTRRVENACADNADTLVRTVCSPIDGGTLLLQYPGAAAVATYLVGDGWLVQVVVDDAGALDTASLTGVATDDSWLR